MAHMTPRRPRRPRAPAVSMATPACAGVVLAVDTARVSGWAIRHAHRLRYSGQLDTYAADNIDLVCELALNISDAAYKRRPPVLVLEQPWGGKRGVLVALGMARERWLAAWERAGLSRRRVVSVMPAQWRAVVLGRGAVRLEREEIRLREMVSARAEVAPAHRDRLGADEAAAILISRWAVRAPAVAALHGSKPPRESCHKCPASPQPAKRKRA